MVNRVFIRLVRAAQARPFHVAHPFVVAAWVAALRMLGERVLILGDGPLGRPGLPWWLHIYAFYLALVFCITALIARLTPTAWTKTLNVVGVGLLLGVAPPLIDFAVYGRGNFAYLYQTGLSTLPWGLYAPPRFLPLGETVILWAAILFVGAYGVWQATAAWRRVILPLAMYLLVFWFLAVLPTVASTLNRLDRGVGFSEWITALLVLCAMVGHILAIGAGRRALARLPQVLLAPSFALLGGALVGRIDAALGYAALLLAELSLGFSLSNDYYDRVEDEAQARPAVVDRNSAIILSLLPLVAVGAGLAVRLELGLCLVAFAAVAHGYQVDPLRTKCVFPLSYKTEGLLAGLALVGGMHSVPGQLLDAGHWWIALIVTVGVPIATVFKDAKDVDADRAAGVCTAFVKAEAQGWPRRRMRWISAGLLALSLGLTLAFAWQWPVPGTYLLGAASSAVVAVGVLVVGRPPARAVWLAILACEGFLLLTAAGLLANPPRPPAAIEPTAPPALTVAASQAAAVAWLAVQQQADGSFILDQDRKFEVWNTVLAVRALTGRGHDDAVAAGWRFLVDAVREDGVAYHQRNRGTTTACTETTALLQTTPGRPSGLALASACALLAASIEADGAVRVNTPVTIIPEPLQTYPSVAGFGLLLSRACPDLPVTQREALVSHARQVFSRPEAIGRPWQYYGTEYYALAALAWGLGPTDDVELLGSLLGYVGRLQRDDGAIPNGGAVSVSHTSLELHTVLALHALVAAGVEPSSEVVVRGETFLRSRQRADGSLPGGDFVSRAARQDILATSLWIELVDRLRR